MPVNSCMVQFSNVVGQRDPVYKAIIAGQNPAELMIPGYQREFDWMEHHFDNLFTDIKNAIATGTNQLYLGPIGIHDMGNSTLAIVDGQQRMTATTLISIALRDECIARGLYSLAQTVHEDLIFYETRPRIVSGEDPKKDDKVNQNKTQLATLQYWPSGEDYRSNPPPKSEIKLIFSDKNTNDIASGAEGKYKFCIEGWMPFAIGGGAVNVWEFENSTLEIQSEVKFEVHGDGATQAGGKIEFEAFVGNIGSNPIEIGAVSKAIDINYKTDHDYFVGEHGTASKPKKSRKMFKRYNFIRNEIKKELDGKSTRNEMLNYAGKITTTLHQFKFTVTLFNNLYDALNYFEKVNDGTFSKPLSILDIFNFRVAQLEQKATELASLYDNLLTSPNTIKELMNGIDEKWSQSKTVLELENDGKKGGNAEIMSVFFQNFLLLCGKRAVGSALLKELEGELPLTYKEPINGQSHNDIMNTFLQKKENMEFFAKCAVNFAPIIIPNVADDRYVRIKHLDKIFKQGRSLLLTAFTEIREAARKTYSRKEINFNNTKDYFSKAKEFYDLEIMIIEAIEFHVARSIVLKPENDEGFKGQDWHNSVINWNDALRSRVPNTSSATEIKQVLETIINGGTTTIQNGATSEIKTITGIKTMNRTKTPSFINGSTIHADIVNKQFSIKDGTFLIWLIESNLRKAYTVEPGTWKYLDIKQDQSLEHILPQSCYKSKDLPIDGWDWWDIAKTNVTGRDDVRDYVDRLGNMCIVAKNINSSFSNKPFSEKQNQERKGEGKVIPSYSTTATSWITMCDLGEATKSNTVVLQGMECFGNGTGQFGLPSHHATLPVTEWNKIQIDNRNKWLFACLQEILK
jgi:hypothetical protein